MFFLDENSDYGYDDNTVSRFYGEGADGILNICLESEMSWNNMLQEAMINEFNAIRNESAYMLNEGVKDWIDKIIEWIKDKIEKIKNWFKSFMNKAGSIGTNVSKFVGTYKSRVSRAQKVSDVNIHTYVKDNLLDSKDIVSKNGAYNIAQVVKLSKSISDASKKDMKSKNITDLVKKFEENLTEFNSALKEDKENFTNEMEKIKNEKIDKYFAFLESYTKQLAAVKSVKDRNLAQLELMRSTAYEVKKKNDDSKGSSNASKVINAMKKGEAYINSLCAFSVQELNTATSDCLAVCRKGLKGVS